MTVPFDPRSAASSGRGRRGAGNPRHSRRRRMTHRSRAAGSRARRARVHWEDGLSGRDGPHKYRPCAPAALTCFQRRPPIIHLAAPSLAPCCRHTHSLSVHSPLWLGNKCREEGIPRPNFASRWLDYWLEYRLIVCLLMAQLRLMCPSAAKLRARVSSKLQLTEPTVLKKTEQWFTDANFAFIITCQTENVDNSKVLLC